MKNTKKSSNIVLLIFGIVFLFSIIVSAILFRKNEGFLEFNFISILSLLISTFLAIISFIIMIKIDNKSKGRDVALVVENEIIRFQDLVERIIFHLENENYNSELVNRYCTKLSNHFYYINELCASMNENVKNCLGKVHNQVNNICCVLDIIHNPDGINVNDFCKKLDDLITLLYQVRVALFK